MSGPPVSLFGMVLGLGGLGLVWREAARRAAWLAVPADVAIAIAAIVFVILAALYARKAIRQPQAVAAEWNGPAHCFFAAITMSVLLLAQAAQPHGREVAYVLFWIGAVGQLALALAIAGRWIGGAFSLGDVTPGWFLPTFGGLLASVAGAALGETEVAWLFFGFALVIGMPILALVLYRLCFHAPLPPPLAPTLVISVAPIALAFLAWQALNGGGPDPFGRVLLYGAVSIALIVATRIPWLAATPFGLSWWAMSFPLDALSGAVLVYARIGGGPDLELIGLVLAAFTSLIILYLFGRTLVFLRSQWGR